MIQLAEHVTRQIERNADSRRQKQFDQECHNCGKPIFDHQNFCKDCFSYLLKEKAIFKCHQCQQWHFINDEFHGEDGHGLSWCVDCYENQGC